MSEDVERAFDKWWPPVTTRLSMPNGSWRGDAKVAFHAGFLAGAESQQARIAELEAERDRLLEVAKTAWVNIGHAEWCGQLDRAGVACDCGMSDLRDLIFITPKEESRG